MERGADGARGGRRTREREELAAIYVGRGLEPALAEQVAEQLMAHDALGAHARDELGISEGCARARPGRAGLGGDFLRRRRSCPLALAACRPVR